MKEIIPYILPSLSFLLSLTVFIVGRLDKKAEKKEKCTQQNGALPPRSKRHL